MEDEGVSSEPEYDEVCPHKEVGSRVVRGLYYRTNEIKDNCGVPKDPNWWVARVIKYRKPRHGENLYDQDRRKDI